MSEAAIRGRIADASGWQAPQCSNNTNTTPIGLYLSKSDQWALIADTSGWQAAMLRERYGE